MLSQIKQYSLKLKLHKLFFMLIVMGILIFPLIDSSNSSAVCFWQAYQIISGIYCQQGSCPYEYGNAHEEKYCIETSRGVTNCGTFDELVSDHIYFFSGCTSSYCPGGSQSTYCKGTWIKEYLSQRTFSCIALLAGDDCSEA